MYTYAKRWKHLASSILSSRQQATSMYANNFAHSYFDDAIWPSLSSTGRVAGIVQTDGLSSVRKVASFNGDVVLIHGDHDQIMPNAFADEFETACAGTAGRFVKITVVNGGHQCEHFMSQGQCAAIASGLGL